MEQSPQERAPDGMTENSPALGPVVFVPLLLILTGAVALIGWLVSSGA